MLLLIISLTVSASDTLILNDQSVRINLVPYTNIYVDSSGVLTIDQILQSKAAFTIQYGQAQNLPFPVAYWLHIPVKAKTTLTARIVIPGDPSHDYVVTMIDQMDLFVVDQQETIEQTARSGFLVPRSKKAIPVEPYIAAVPIQLTAREQRDIYIRLQSKRSSTTFPIALELRSTGTSLPRVDLSGRWIILGPWGMFIIIGLFVLVFYFYVKEPSFLYFSIFCLLYSQGLFCIEPEGGFINFIPEYPEWRSLIFSISLLSIIGLLFFGNAFVDIKKHFPSWYRYFQFVIAVFVVVVAYYILRSFWPPYVSYHIGILASILLLIPICIRFVRSTNWKARLFAIGIFSFLGGNGLGVLALMYGYNWGPLAWIAGQLILLFLFAVGLGRRLLESERERARAEKITELEAMKSRFFANISHEFRTPLSLILGPLQKAEESVPASELENDKNRIVLSMGQIGLMKRNTLRLQQLIDQILDLSKIESQKMQLHLAQGAIVKFIRSRIAEFEDIAANKKIHFVLRYPAENDTAFFDADKLEKILVNILSNAVKFTPENGQIEVDVDTDEKFLQVIIADTGPGMSKAELAHVFDRFYQSDNARHQGTGIGMALVKELIAIHKGSVTITSQEGRGTTVNFKICIHPDYFPAHTIHTTAADIRHKPNQNLSVLLEGNVENPEPPGQNHEQVILVVEDNAEMQLFIKELLSEHFDVLTAKDGREGIHLAIEHLPDLIVSDVMMPEVSGIELCDQLKKDERTSHIPILLLTAKSEQKDEHLGLKTGADDYLTKPFDQKTLLLKINNLLRLIAQVRKKYSKQPWNSKLQNVTSLDERFLQNVNNAIQQNLSNEYYSVEELAKEVGYSRSQLFRKLKALTNKSPLDMIRLHRLHYAKGLLEKQAMSVSEVAYMVGYSNLSYFSQSFKKEFGVLPSEIGMT